MNVDPVPNRTAKRCDRAPESIQLVAAPRTFRDVPEFLALGSVNETLCELVGGQMIAHFDSPKRFRMPRTALTRCTFTVLSVSPVASAISQMLRSSIYRRRKTVRCLSDKVLVASHTA